MKAFNIIETGKGPDSWSQVDVADPTPRPGQVLIRVKAVSLNTRDLMIASGYFPIPPKKNVIPVSDGAGEIVAVGAGVTRWDVGDRVFGSYYQHWHNGQFPADAELFADHRPGLARSGLARAFDARQHVNDCRVLSVEMMTGQAALIRDARYRPLDRPYATRGLWTNN